MNWFKSRIRRNSRKSTSAAFSPSASPAGDKKRSLACPASGRAGFSLLHKDTTLKTAGNLCAFAGGSTPSDAAVISSNMSIKEMLFVC